MKCPYCIKICSKCNRLLVACSMNFHKQKKGKYGVTSQCKECKKKYTKQWNENNKEHIAEHNKQWNEANPEYGKQWRENNRERNNELSRKAENKRRALKAQNGGEYTLEQWQECLEFFDYKCAYSGEPINNSNVNVEHIIPISKGGTNNITNIVPALDTVNFSKNASDMLSWYKEQPYYSEERLNKILDWIEYASNKYELNTISI